MLNTARLPSGIDPGNRAGVCSTRQGIPSDDAVTLSQHGGKGRLLPRTAGALESTRDEQTVTLCTCCAYCASLTFAAPTLASRASWRKWASLYAGEHLPPQAQNGRSRQTILDPLPRCSGLYGSPQMAQCRRPRPSSPIKKRGGVTRADPARAWGSNR